MKKCLIMITLFNKLDDCGKCILIDHECYMCAPWLIENWFIIIKH